LDVYPRQRVRENIEEEVYKALSIKETKRQQRKEWINLVTVSLEKKSEKMAFIFCFKFLSGMHFSLALHFFRLDFLFFSFGFTLSPLALHFFSLWLYIFSSQESSQSVYFTRLCQILLEIEQI